MCKNGKTGVPFLALDWKTGNHFLKFSTTLRRNGRVSRFFILILKLIPFNTTLGTYSRFENREKIGGSPYLIFFYGPRYEGTQIFILARVSAEIRLFGAKRKIKSIFKRWIRLVYTLKNTK